VICRALTAALNAAGWVLGLIVDCPETEPEPPQTEREPQEPEVVRQAQKVGVWVDPSEPLMRRVLGSYADDER
jgi:hypothetical protein